MYLQKDANDLLTHRFDNLTKITKTAFIRVQNKAENCSKEDHFLFPDPKHIHYTCCLKLLIFLSVQPIPNSILV